MDLSQSQIHVIACGVLASDLRHVCQQLGLPVSLECLAGGLHTRPEQLREQLQQRIDQASGIFRGDRIVVGYGVCGRGTVGLQARNVPLVIPRVNDCIALFLGSDQAYRQQFSRYPGTYYISAGWVEEKSQPLGQEATIQCGPDCYTLPQLVERYGEDNADAIRTFLSSWQRNYQRAAFIDTGLAGPRRKYAQLARAMADQFGWQYEEIRGSHDLLRQLLTATSSSDAILLVPAHHVTVHDPISRTLAAVPVWHSASPTTVQDASHDQTLVFEQDAPAGPTSHSAPARLGLGIDAGGTYTDVVLYDFARDEVVEKAKALTTKWDYTIGISAALDQLTPARLTHVDLVSMSTTLATNAIVESRGQKVGLLVFPPYGLFRPTHIAYRPLAVLSGQLEIDGRELVPVDEDQLRREVRCLLDVEQVAAFAVSGYASHVNPDHELQARRIIQEETGLWASCAHELSEQCDYRVRSVTAALNASIIPYLDAFLRDADRILQERAITAPRMVVKSDGTLMSLRFARRQPIATILSGPAASVAGASYLARLDDAMVVDMGGTTTDTATLRRGCVRFCTQGAQVGAWRTHVQALDLRTLGLGGDSLIAHGRSGQLTIGPARVAPVAWLYRDGADDLRALTWLEQHLDRYTRSTSGMELVAANGAAVPNGLLSDVEQQILTALASGPCSVDELTERLGRCYCPAAQLTALQDRHLVVRAALTPTDIAHAARRVELWNVDAAERLCRLFGRLANVPLEELVRQVHNHVVRHMAWELLRSHLGQAADGEGDRHGLTSALVENWLQGGNDDFQLHVNLRYPIIGIGAPTHLYLPDVAELLETTAVLPRHADVANAIGAITGRVAIHRQVEIEPTENGTYRIRGLPGSPTFGDFRQAQQHAVEQLVPLVRQQAAEAGTSCTRVQIQVHDRVAPSGYGGQLLVGRTLTAQLIGRPDVARLLSKSLDA